MILEIIKFAYSFGKSVIRVASIYPMMNFSETSDRCRDALHQSNLVIQGWRSRGAVHHFIAASHSSLVFFLFPVGDVLYLATNAAFQFSRSTCATSHFPSRVIKSQINDKGGSCSLPEFLSPEYAAITYFHFSCSPAMLPSFGSY